MTWNARDAALQQLQHLEHASVFKTWHDLRELVCKMSRPTSQPYWKCFFFLFRHLVALPLFALSPTFTLHYQVLEVSFFFFFLEEDTTHTVYTTRCYRKVCNYPRLPEIQYNFPCRETHFCSEFWVQPTFTYFILFNYFLFHKKIVIFNILFYFMLLYYFIYFIKIYFFFKFN